jgi:hypothetical protein
MNTAHRNTVADTVKQEALTVFRKVWLRPVGKQRTEVGLPSISGLGAAAKKTVALGDDALFEPG